MYRDRQMLGMEIKITSPRKSIAKSKNKLNGKGNGGSGRGISRNSHTQKKAIVTRNGIEHKPVYGNSFKDISNKLRRIYDIPTWANINKRGVTNL